MAHIYMSSHFGDCTPAYLVTDNGKHRLLRISGVDGSIVWVAGSWGDGPQQFSFPSDVAVLLDGRVVVADSWNHRIQVLDTATGRFIEQMG